MAAILSQPQFVKRLIWGHKLPITSYSAAYHDNKAGRPWWHWACRNRQAVLCGNNNPCLIPGCSIIIRAEWQQPPLCAATMMYCLHKFSVIQSLTLMWIWCAAVEKFEKETLTLRYGDFFFSLIHLPLDKWPPFCRHFQMQCLEWRSSIDFFF